MSDILSRVKKVITAQLGVGEDKIELTSSFVDDLGADSLDQVELMMKFEDEFEGLEIPDEDSEKLRTVGDAVKYLEGRGVS